MSAPQFDPATYDAQLAEKAARLVELLAPFDAPAPEVFDSPREHYRLRSDGLLTDDVCSDSTGRILAQFDIDF